MSELGNQAQPYALKAGEGRTYRFGVDFTVKQARSKVVVEQPSLNMSRTRGRSRRITPTRPKTRCSMCLKVLSPSAVVNGPLT